MLFNKSVSTSWIARASSYTVRTRTLGNQL